MPAQTLPCYVHAAPALRNLGKTLARSRCPHDAHYSRCARTMPAHVRSSDACAHAHLLARWLALHLHVVVLASLYQQHQKQQQQRASAHTVRFLIWILKRRHHMHTRTEDTSSLLSVCFLVACDRLALATTRERKLASLRACFVAVERLCSHLMRIRPRRCFRWWRCWWKRPRRRRPRSADCRRA